MPLFRRMNEKEALEKTLLLWDYLAKHPEQEKIDAYKALHLSRDGDDCPLCEYTSARCHMCPLISLWPSTDAYAPCVHDQSVYSKWRIKHTFETAKQIADAARAKLEELKHDRD